MLLQINLLLHTYKCKILLTWTQNLFLLPFFLDKLPLCVIKCIIVTHTKNFNIKRKETRREKEKRRKLFEIQLLHYHIVPSASDFIIILHKRERDIICVIYTLEIYSNSAIS